MMALNSNKWIALSALVLVIYMNIFSIVNAFIDHSVVQINYIITSEIFYDYLFTDLLFLIPYNR